MEESKDRPWLVYVTKAGIGDIYAGGGVVPTEQVAKWIEQNCCPH